MPTHVNSQITDSVAQAGTQVLASASTMAMASIYQSLSHATAIGFQNAVLAQHHAAISAQAAANLGVIQIYGRNALPGAIAIRRMSHSSTTSQLAMVLIAMELGRRRQGK